MYFFRHVEELQQQLKLREKAEMEKVNDLCGSQGKMCALPGPLDQFWSKWNFKSFQSLHSVCDAAGPDCSSVTTP